MKKFVKIVFKDKKKDPVFISLEKWKGMVEDPKTLVAYTLDSEIEWTGRTMNKSEILASDPDDGYTKMMNPKRLIEEPEIIEDPESRERVNAIGRATLEKLKSGNL